MMPDPYGLLAVEIKPNLDQSCLREVGQKLALHYLEKVVKRLEPILSSRDYQKPDQYCLVKED